MNAVVGSLDAEFGLGSADGTPAWHREPLCPLFEPVLDTWPRVQNGPLKCLSALAADGPRSAPLQRVPISRLESTSCLSQGVESDLGISIRCADYARRSCGPKLKIEISRRG